MENLLIVILAIVAIRLIVKLIKRIVASIDANRKRREREQAIASVQIARAEAAQQKEAARLEREQEKRRAAELKRTQAAADLDYIEQARQAVLKLYGAAEADYNNATTDRKRETALNRMLSYDAKLRKLDKERERAAMIQRNK